MRILSSQLACIRYLVVPFPAQLLALRNNIAVGEHLGRPCVRHQLVFSQTEAAKEVAEMSHHLLFLAAKAAMH